MAALKFRYLRGSTRTSPPKLTQFFWTFLSNLWNVLPQKTEPPETWFTCCHVEKWLPCLTSKRPQRCVQRGLSASPPNMTAVFAKNVQIFPRGCWPPYTFAHFSSPFQLFQFGHKSRSITQWISLYIVSRPTVVHDAQRMSKKVSATVCTLLRHYYVVSTRVHNNCLVSLRVPNSAVSTITPVKRRPAWYLSSTIGYNCNSQCLSLLCSFSKTRQRHDSP